MKKSIFPMFAVVLAASMLYSCSTKQTAINKLEKFSYELRDNGQYYTYKDWQNAADEFTQIRKKLNKYDYSSEDRQYIGELEGKCAGYVYKGVKGKVQNLGSELNGILQGLLDSIER